MKTKISVFSILLFIAIGSFAQFKTLTLADLDMKGKVKSVNETTYLGVLKFGDLTKGNKTTYSEEKFNKEGLATKRDYTYYDEDGKKEDGFIQSFTFDKKNQLVELEEEDVEEEELYRYKLTNDAQGKVQVMDVLSKKGKLIFRHKFKYNSAGKVIEEVKYDSDGNPNEKITTSYSSDGKRHEEIIFDKSDKIKEKNIYVFDERGNKIESTNFTFKSGKMDEYTRQFKYNQNNKITEERNSISGLDKKEVFLYDDKGNLVRHVDEYGSTKVHTYTYDAQGNWVKRVSDIKDKFLGNKMEITERSISYY